MPYFSSLTHFTARILHLDYLAMKTCEIDAENEDF